MTESEIKEVVRAVFDAENAARAKVLDDMVLKAVATILTSFGIDEEDRSELKADFIHLRKWRKSVDQIQGYTFKAVVTVIITGIAGMIWMGVKTVLGK